MQQRIDNVSDWLAADNQANRAGVKNTAEFPARLQRVVLANARLDLRLGRFDIAQKTVVKYLKMRPNDARAYYLFGEILRQRDGRDDADNAVSYYEKAMSLDPSYPEPHKAMGLVHYKHGQKRLAKKFFESCLRLSPNTSDKAYIQGYLKNCKFSGEES